MLFKNRLEKLLYNDEHNTYWKGKIYNETVQSMYDLPGKLYKTRFICNDTMISGPVTCWLIANLVEEPGINPYVEIRKAWLSGDESHWFCNQRPIQRLYSAKEVDIYTCIIIN